MKKLLLLIPLLPSLLFAQLPCSIPNVSSVSGASTQRFMMCDAGTSKYATLFQMLDTTRLVYTYSRDNGYLYFNGTKWIAKNGTSDQFMMADGSFNSNTYLTTGSAASTYQPILVSGTSIKTINGNSLLGSGDLAITGATPIVPNRVAVGGNSGVVRASNAIDTTELNYLDGATSNIQTQLNSKLSSYTETDPITKAIVGIVSSDGTTISAQKIDSSLRRTVSRGLAVNNIPKFVSTTTYAPTDADHGSVIYYTNSSPVTVTLTNGVRLGGMISHVKAGTGNVIFTFTSPITSIDAVDNNDTLVKQWSPATTHYKTATTWFLGGALGTPTSGGGGSVADASPTVKGIAKLYADVTNNNTDGAPDQNSVKVALATKQPQLNGAGFVKASGTTISYDPTTYVPTTRNINTTAPVTGGGDMSADRTITVSTATPTTTGVLKLKSDVTGNATDGAPDQNSVKNALASKQDTLPKNKLINRRFLTQLGDSANVTNTSWSPILNTDMYQGEQISLGWGNGASFYNFGDSFTQGSLGYDPYPIAIAEKLGTVLDNRGISGDGTYLCFKRVATVENTFPQRRSATLMIGFNDIRANHTTIGHTRVKNGVRAIIAQHLLATAVPANSGSVTTTGTWTTVAAGTFNDKASISLAGLARQSSVIGSTLSYTFTGTNLVIGCWGSDVTAFNDGSFTVKVDTVTKATWNPNGNGVTFVGTGENGRNNNAIVLYDLGSGSHTVTITTTQAKPTLIDYFGTLQDVGSAPTMLIMGLLKQTTAGYNSKANDDVFETANQNIISVINEYRLQGYGVKYVEGNSNGWNPATMISTVDNVHPLPSGCAKIAENFLRAIGRNFLPSQHSQLELYGKSSTSDAFLRVVADNGVTSARVLVYPSGKGIAGWTGPLVASYHSSATSVIYGSVVANSVVNLVAGGFNLADIKATISSAGVFTALNGTGAGGTQIISKGPTQLLSGVIKAENDVSSNIMMQAYGSSIHTFGKPNGVALSTNQAEMYIGGTTLANNINFFSRGTGLPNLISKIDSTGSYLIGMQTSPTSLKRGIAIYNSIAPSAPSTDATILYAIDRGGQAGKNGLHILTEDGTGHVWGDRVGVGTIAPRSGLHVNKSIRCDSLIGTLNGALYADAGGIIKRSTNVTFDETNGRVGIGVATPTAALHLKAGTATAGTAPLKIPTGTNLTTTEDGAIERSGDVVTFTNSGLVRQELMQSQQARVATNFNATTVTMTDITDLTRTLSAGKTYRFRAVFYLSPNATGGFKLSVTGGVSSGSPVYLDQRLYFDNGASTVMLSERNTSLGNASTSTGSTSGMAVYEGTITPSVTGTLVFQFAQNVASGTSTILAGSNVVITQIQ